MSLLNGRVAIVTGAGRGIGRSYALMLAQHGARVVVNDMGSSAAGEGADQTPAQDVVGAIQALGGEAIVNTSDVADWGGAQQLIDQAVSAFGRLDILINNAGILRDRMLVNMTENEWDSVVRVHLKGTFVPTHHAANYWRQQQKLGEAVDARVINTTSHSALFANVGQANYAAAKGGVATFTQIAARELERYGVTVNAISPRANTRMNEGLREYSAEEEYRRDPAWIAALVAWIASAESRNVSGRVFEAWGNGFSVLESWQHGPQAEASRDPTEIGERIGQIVRFARANAGVNRNEWHVP